MPTMNISLTDELKQVVEKRVADGRYSSVSEYVRELIRADERRRAEDDLEAYLLEGLKGPSRPFTDEVWREIQAEASARANRELDTKVD